MYIGRKMLLYLYSKNTIGYIRLLKYFSVLKIKIW
jgi:hypothetical protein